MAAADEQGNVWDIRGHKLGAKQCLDLILSLPDDAVIVGYSLSYDITKMLEELPDRKLHRLLHPERRRRLVDGKVRYRAVRWNEYLLDYMNGRLTIRSNGIRRVVWDIWRFFQSRFVKALEEWGVATSAELAEMQDMKERRGAFDQEDPKRVEEYCKAECQRLAQLFRSLLDAHADAGLRLKSYYGAGSTSSALLDRMGIRDAKRDALPEMRHAIACAFMGGRFENSHIGPISGPLHDSDISSAYPYHATLLPCLEHGRWSHCHSPSDSDIASSSAALVRWYLPYRSPVGAWAPFPVRGQDGRVVYPWSAPGGWVWRDEFIQGKRLRDDAEALEAWLYHSDCDCRPFGALPEYYLERIRVGKKTGRGKVFKLGPNGVYGKLAQTVGHSPPYQSFIWAGIITSNTRAQLLQAILSALDPWDILAVATDGVLSRIRLELPAPRDTGTFSAPIALGAWEQETEGGRFLARPGISFPLDGDAKVKSRGYGKARLKAQGECISEAWRHGHAWACIDDGERFGSALSELHLSQSGYSRGQHLGDWYRSFKLMSFDPAPKRVWGGERTEGPMRLHLIREWPEESYPYEPALHKDVMACQRDCNVPLRSTPEQTMTQSQKGV